MFCQYSSTTTMYCNTITSKDAIEDHQIILGVGVVVEIDETPLRLNTTLEGSIHGRSVIVKLKSLPTSRLRC